MPQIRYPVYLVFIEDLSLCLQLWMIKGEEKIMRSGLLPDISLSYFEQRFIVERMAISVTKMCPCVCIFY